jgi:hypothetical protein
MDLSFWTVMKGTGVTLATLACYAYYNESKGKKKELSKFLN